MWSVKLIWFHALENYNQSLNNYRVITVEYIQCNSYYFNCNCYAWGCATDFKIRDRDLRCVFINFEPKTLSAENFEIMVQIKLKKMPMEDCLNNLLAQFNKLYPWSLKKSTSEDQTERKNDNFETPPGIKKKSRLWDSKITRKQDFETHQKRLRDFEIGPKFCETNVFWGTILYSYNVITGYVIHTTLPATTIQLRNYCCFS